MPPFICDACRYLPRNVPHPVAKRSIHNTLRLGTHTSRVAVGSYFWSDQIRSPYNLAPNNVPGHRRGLATRRGSHRSRSKDGPPQRDAAIRGGRRRDKSDHKSDDAGLENSGKRKFRPSIDNFPETLEKRLEELKPALLESPLFKALQEEDIQQNRKVTSPSDTWKAFVQGTNSSRKDTTFASKSTSVRETLMDAYLHKGGIVGLDIRIRHEFYDFIINARLTATDFNALKRVADFRYPMEWYPATRRIKRQVHLHVGPTNSGKTYHALKRLEQAETGVYAGPLRLLAHEVYSRLNANGKNCVLITGEERRAALASDGTVLPFTDDTIKIRSCTVEMVPLNMIMDVAVLDEIQMIADRNRGWAWTQAFLGICAKELHVCGEKRTVPLIKELSAMVGDELHIHEYERLTPLKMDRKSIDGDLKQLRKGDAIVSFSVMGIHSLKKEIQKITGKKAAIVYGSLPPETRAQQARLFNDPDNDYDFLVASDAVGMGLNLAIKRVIFETSYKFDGYSVQKLKVSDIKQIGGRAGRFRVPGSAKDENSDDVIIPQDMPSDYADDADAAAHEGYLPKIETPTPKNNKKEGYNGGLITTLDPYDFPIVNNAMNSEPEPIRSAGILPPLGILERFTNYFHSATPFSYIIARLNEIGATTSRFFVCTMKDGLKVSAVLDDIPDLSIADRAILAAAPVGRMTEYTQRLMRAYATCIATQSGGNLLDIPDLPLEILEEEVTGNREQLANFENLHAAVIVYLWLSYRFAGVFTARPLAQHVKEMVEEKISLALDRVGLSGDQRRDMTRERKRRFEEAERLERENKARQIAEAAINSNDEEAEHFVDEDDSEGLGEESVRDEADMEDELESSVRYIEKGDIPLMDSVEEEELVQKEHAKLS